jgi:hypothetical protein
LLAALCCTATAEQFAPSAPAKLNTNANTDSGADRRPQVVTDGVANWIAVWFSSDDLNGTIGTDYDILVSRSTNNGQTWTPPTALNTNAATDEGSDERPQLATDGAGNWVAVWYSNDSLGETIGTDYDILVSCSTDAGVTWTAPAALNSNASSDSGIDQRPQIATDVAGNWMVVWSSNEPLNGSIGLDYDILFALSADRGATWTDPAPIHSNARTDAGSDIQPQLTMDGLGNWLVVWESGDALGGTIGTDHDILFARSMDAGATWTAPAPINTNAATDSGDDEIPHVTTDGRGHWVTVWYSDDSMGGTVGTDNDIFFARSIDNGATWTPPAALNTNAATDLDSDDIPHIKTDLVGNWIVVWNSVDTLGDTKGADADVLYAQSTNGGATWAAPQLLNTNGRTDVGEDIVPKLAARGVNHWVTVWESTDTLGDTIGPDRDIVFTRFVILDSDSDGLSDVSEIETYATKPLEADSDGDGQIDGHEILDGSQANNPASASPVPRTYPAPLNVISVNDSGDDTRPRVTTNGDGNWVAVWHSNDALADTVGTDYDILVSRSTERVANWTTPAPLNANAATDLLHDHDPQLAVDNSGTWVAVWSSSDPLGNTIGTDFDVLASRSADAGATWSAPTALNVNAAADSGSDMNPQLATDGAGNWVAVWHSDETFNETVGPDNDILFARSTDKGATWSAPAALNADAMTDSGSDERPCVTTDGKGNWLAVWHSNNGAEETVAGTYNILASRSTNNGATWTAPVALNATDSGSNFDPQVTTDAGGNWIAVWRSVYGFGSFKIYVSRSVNNGLTWTAPVPLHDRSTNFDPQVTTDRFGNWVAVWRSFDSMSGLIGHDWDILMRRSMDNGATWTAPVALNTNAAIDSGEDVAPSVATDRVGNWVAVWQSRQAATGGGALTDYDIHFSRWTSVDPNRSPESGDGGKEPSGVAIESPGPVSP